MEPSDHSHSPTYSPTLSLALWRLQRQTFENSSSPLTSDKRLVTSTTKKGRIFGKTLWPWYWLGLVCVLLSMTTVVNACGPGRGAGRRRAPRKLTPIVYKQHVPNVPENAISASGLSEGKILRGDTQRFKDLVPNYNPDILFRDDEGTGADRLMTHKLREKLNTLAISVMNQWPGVKLRVLEGWDEDLLHSPNSLHYEGRAVDIQTSDKDSSKNGMLARLAVEVGFDWVFYETRNHIHCSVKSDSFQSGRAGGCFSGNSTVKTIFGTKTMSEVKVGDEILAVYSSGVISFSPVILFLDRNHSEVREFYEIQTAFQTLRLTPSHLLHIIPAAVAKTNWDPSLFLESNELSATYSEESESAELMVLAEITFARNIAIGDWILSVGGNQTKIERSRVLKIQALELQGVFAPLTTTGTVVVDGVVSSCYAVIDSQSLAHLSFLPFRLFHNLRQGLSHLWQGVTFVVTLGNQVLFHAGSTSIVNHLSQDSLRSEVTNGVEDEGINWYASCLYTLTNRIVPSALLYHNS